MTTFVATTSGTATGLGIHTHFALAANMVSVHGHIKIAAKQVSSKKNNVVDGIAHDHMHTALSKATASKALSTPAVHGAIRVTGVAPAASSIASMSTQLLTMAAANKPYASSHMSTLPATISAGQNTVVPSYAIAALTTCGMIMSATMVAGSRGGATMYSELTTLLAADKPYASAKMRTSALSMFAANTSSYLMMPGAIATSSVTAIATMAVAFTSSLSVQDAWGQYGLNTYTSVEQATIVDGVSAVARYSILLQDNLYASGIAQIGSQTYDCLVVNTTTRAPSRYAGHSFNSFAKIGDTYYGAAADGLYALSGSTDAGTAIIASVLTMSTNAGSIQQKNVPTAYVGVRASGAIQLNVTTDDGIAHQYTLTEHSGDSVHNERVLLGKGARGAYWQFELTNPDGQDFEVDYLEILPVILTRRV